MTNSRSYGDASYDFSAQRLFIDSDLSPDHIYSCDSSQANYLLNVLRMKAGDNIYVFNGRDGEWKAAIESGKKNKCTLEIVEKVREQTKAQDIEYLFAPVKRARLDYMIQKATELGVSALKPVITHRTIVERVKEDRMKANAVEAAEQCGILNIPEVYQPVKLSKLLDNWTGERVLVHCDEAAEIKSPIERLSMLKKGPISILIGPEGGFDTQERERLRGLKNAVSLSLGPRIMRADTAAIAALTLVNAVLGDWDK